MNLLSLEYFLVLTEELNFTKAATRLYITQQSLSGHIKKLEDYFGCLLFDRGSPLSLTMEGLGLERAARKLLSLATDMEKEIQDIRDLRNGEIIIGITRIRGNIYLPPILTRFHEEYPNIKISIFEGNSVEVETALHRAQIDLSIGSIPAECQNVQSIPFWREENVLVIPLKILMKYFPADYQSIIDEDRPLSLYDVRYCPFIAMDADLRAGHEFQSSCHELGISPKIVLTAKSLSVLIPLSLNGLGILVCPEVFLLPYRSALGSAKKPIVLVRPANQVMVPRDMRINYLKQKYLSSAAKEFLQILKQETASLSWSLY